MRKIYNPRLNRRAKFLFAMGVIIAAEYFTFYYLYSQTH